MKQINFLQGCVFFIFKYEFLVGWGKNMIIYYEKRKNKGEEVDKRERRGNFYFTWGKNVIFEKGMVGGQKYQLF